VHVSVGARGGWAHVAVRDDGVGFDPNAARAAAHGLAGMRFRVQSARGELKIRSKADQGTTIQARLPLPDHVQDAVDSTMDVASLLGPGTFPQPASAAQRTE
jgi:nitrate/nitrite-specific signal transduction histidine kinase